ncbi:hypothetical protein OHU78_07310 [Pseudomonas aeruginosa]|uniref:hypothetical protein n=1 Tax=Pseudomonas aeruginosa TaxID=287 RepID=UPI0021E74602|nr:hypothetical protein [Pseudomonas aeruginosa]MCV4004483.1 hypothetical protein [Pseudomonas aeruginosa]
MSEVKRFDHVNHAHIDDCEHVESSEGAWVTASDYDALAAKLAMAEDAAAKGDAARQQCGGMEMEIEELRAELAELRARVVVVPEHKDDLPPIYEDENLPAFHHYKGWNACLDELARLNGKTVSEGLLREVARHLGNWLELHECECDGGFHYCGRDQVAKTNRELRALLNQDKENGDHAA